MLVKDQAYAKTSTDFTIYFKKTTIILVKKSQIDPET